MHIRPGWPIWAPHNIYDARPWWASSAYDSENYDAGVDCHYPITIGNDRCVRRAEGFAADWADPAKVLKVAFPTDVSGLDPAGTQETYASVLEARIFDALYVWDYHARPYRFVPSIASSMPEISADGRIWTIHIRRGIYFADDPAFEGKKRELTAADFVYAWKRVVDPRVRSPNSDLLDTSSSDSTPRLPKPT